MSGAHLYLFDWFGKLFSVGIIYITHFRFKCTVIRRMMKEAKSFRGRIDAKSGLNFSPGNTGFHIITGLRHVHFFFYLLLILLSYLSFNLISVNLRTYIIQKYEEPFKCLLFILQIA